MSKNQTLIAAGERSAEDARYAAARTALDEAASGAERLAGMWLIVTAIFGFLTIVGIAIAIFTQAGCGWAAGCYLAYVISAFAHNAHWNQRHEIKAGAERLAAICGSNSQPNARSAGDRESNQPNETDANSTN